MLQFDEALLVPQGYVGSASKDSNDAAEERLISHVSAHLGSHADYQQLAKQILESTLKWDPELRIASMQTVVDLLLSSTLVSRYDATPLEYT